MGAVHRPATASDINSSNPTDDIRRSLICLFEIKALLQRLLSDEGVAAEIISDAEVIVSKSLPLLEKLLRELTAEEEEEEEAGNDGERKDDVEMDNDDDEETGENLSGEEVTEDIEEEIEKTGKVLAPKSSDNKVETLALSHQQQQQPSQQQQQQPQPPFHSQPQQTFRIKSISNAVKPFTCSYCSKSFTQNKYLQQHIACRHEGAVNECPHCNKHFSSETNLKIHLQTHKEAREEFCCELCDKVRTRFPACLKGSVDLEISTTS